MAGIPKIIHFIWAGGLGQMPIENQPRILDWAKKNPDFKIHIWVDYKTAKGNSLEEQEQGVRKWYKNLISQAGKGSDGQDRVILKDVDTDLYDTSVKREEQSYKYFRYEISRLRPNYGASSDLLRYKILHKFGGAYFDSDVLPGEKTLAESGIEFDSITRDCLWVNKNTQGTGMIGNDAFVVTSQDNPVMLSILNRSVQNYGQMKDIVERSSLGGGLKRCFPGSYDSYEFLDAFTPHLTGPSVVDTLVSHIIETEENQSPDTHSVRYLQADCICLPKYADGTQRANDRHWLKMPLQYKSVDPDVILSQMLESDYFELVNMNIWRINDSFYNYYELTGKCLDLNDYIKRMEAKLGSSLAEFLESKKTSTQDLLSLEDRIKKDKDIDFFCTESMEKILERYAVPMRNLNLINLKQSVLETGLINGERNDLLPAIVAKVDGTFDVMYVDSSNGTIISIPLTEEDRTITELFEEHTIDLKIGGGIAPITLPSTDRRIEKFSVIFPVAETKSIAAIDITKKPELAGLNEHAKQVQKDIGHFLTREKSGEPESKKTKKT